MFYTPHPFDADALSGFTSPKGGWDQGVIFPSNRGTPPPTLNSKIPSILLARRRGDNASHSHGVEDVPSSASTDSVIINDASGHSDSRFDEGNNQMVSKECFDETMDHEKNGPEFNFVSSSRSPLAAIPELGHPALYSWPQVERIDMFDVGDLDAKAVFVLVASQQTEEYVVYVWVGRECNQQKENDEMYWQSIAQGFLHDLKCGARVLTRVCISFLIICRVAHW